VCARARVFKECVRDPGSYMWIYVLLGNALRGVGETPVTPLGISYIDDYAKAENSPFYIGTKPSNLLNDNASISLGYPTSMTVEHFPVSK